MAVRGARSVADGDSPDSTTRASMPRLSCSSARRPSRSSSIRWHGSQTIVISKTASPRADSLADRPLLHVGALHGQVLADGTRLDPDRLEVLARDEQHLALRRPCVRAPLHALPRDRAQALMTDRPSALAARRRPDPGDPRHGRQSSHASSCPTLRVAQAGRPRSSSTHAGPSSARPRRSAAAGTRRA